MYHSFTQAVLVAMSLWGENWWKTGTIIPCYRGQGVSTIVGGYQVSTKQPHRGGIKHHPGH